MTRLARLRAAAYALGALAALAASGHAFAQTTTDAVLDSIRADGKAFARDKAAAAQSAATTNPDASRLPNFGGVPSQSGYFGDPDRMSREAASQASANSGYAAMRSSMQSRARFTAQDLDAVIARSDTISQDPLAFTSGMTAGGTQGRCVPLPQSSASPGTYQASCNTGYKLEDYPGTCTIPLSVSIRTVFDYHYNCTTGGVQGQPACSALPTSICRQSGSHAGPCQQWGTDAQGNAVCTTPGATVYEYTCSSPVGGVPLVSVTSYQVADTRRDESQCAAYTANTMCFSQGEICTDSSPETRTIGGIAVTAPCWAWKRDYQCYRYVPMQDCDALAATPGCTVKSETCITGETPCRTYERVYTCPLPPERDGKQQFICDGDIYCIDGSCEKIEREANDEFKDAVVALNSMAQARREWDPSTLSLFKGNRETCASKVFGILNCCKGKGFPLIPGIQLLVALGCSREEMLLHERDVQGLCAYVGTYCSSSFLGVCLTKRKTYCCFESKLTRIIQEQGRAQMGRPWGNSKTETCAGFTVAEFARLDLSRMDFSEVYAEFTDAARLPGELDAATEIQQKIEDYYARVR